MDVPMNDGYHRKFLGPVLIIPRGFRLLLLSSSHPLPTPPPPSLRAVAIRKGDASLHIIYTLYIPVVGTTINKQLFTINRFSRRQNEWEMYSTVGGNFFLWLIDMAWMKWWHEKWLLKMAIVSRAADIKPPKKLGSIEFQLVIPMRQYWQAEEEAPNETKFPRSALVC